MGVWMMNGMVVFVGLIIVLVGVWGLVFLIIQNFWVILKYNVLDSYVLVVVYLGEVIVGWFGIQGVWLCGDCNLLNIEKVEIQCLLMVCGFDIGGVDGKLGLKLVEVIWGFQCLCGMVLDGYVDVVLLGVLCG